MDLKIKWQDHGGKWRASLKDSSSIVIKQNRDRFAWTWTRPNGTSLSGTTDTLGEAKTAFLDDYQKWVLQQWPKGEYSSRRRSPSQSFVVPLT